MSQNQNLESTILEPGDYLIELAFARKCDREVLGRALTNMGWEGIVFDESSPGLSPTTGAYNPAFAAMSKPAPKKTAAPVRRAVARPGAKPVRRLGKVSTAVSTVPRSSAMSTARPSAFSSTVAKPRASLAALIKPVVTPSAVSPYIKRPGAAISDLAKLTAEKRLRSLGKRPTGVPDAPGETPPAETTVTPAAEQAAAAASVFTPPSGTPAVAEQTPIPIAPIAKAAAQVAPDGGGGGGPSPGGGGGGPSPGGGGGGGGPSPGEGGGYEPPAPEVAPEAEAEAEPDAYAQAPAEEGSAAEETLRSLATDLSKLIPGQAPPSQPIPNETDEIRQLRLQNLWRRWLEWGSPFATSPSGKVDEVAISQVQISGEGEDDPTRVRFIAHLGHRLQLASPPGMWWVYVKQLDGIDYRGDIRIHVQPHRLSPGSFYEFRLFTREKSAPTREDVKRRLGEMGFAPMKLALLKRNIRLPGKPSSLAMWYGIGQWLYPSTVVTVEDPFYFEQVREVVA